MSSSYASKNLQNSDEKRGFQVNDYTYNNRRNYKWQNERRLADRNWV